MDERRVTMDEKTSLVHHPSSLVLLYYFYYRIPHPIIPIFP